MQYEFEDCHDFGIVHRVPFFISIGVAGLSHDLRHEERFYVEATFTLTPEDGPIGTWTFQQNIHECTPGSCKMFSSAKMN